MFMLQVLIDRAAVLFAFSATFKLRSAPMQVPGRPSMYGVHLALHKYLQLVYACDYSSRNALVLEGNPESGTS